MTRENNYFGDNGENFSGKNDLAPKEAQGNTSLEEPTLTEGINQFKYASTVEGKAEKTIDQYDYVFDKFIKYLGEDLHLTEVSPSIIRGFLKSLMDDDDLSKATVAIHHRVLQAFFNWLVAEGLLEQAPTENIKEPKTPKKYPRILNKEQVDKLIQAAKNNSDSWAGYRNYTIIVCFVDMGLRLNELINASLLDLNFGERTLKVRGKGAKDRMVYFGQETYKALRKWTDMRDRKENQLDETIFISQSGEKLKTRYVEHIVSRLQNEAGLNDTKVSPHVLRHTAATLAVENGIDTFALKRFFGWESIRTAIKYVHLGSDAVKDSFTQASPLDNLNKQS